MDAFKHYATEILTGVPKPNSISPGKREKMKTTVPSKLHLADQTRKNLQDEMLKNFKFSEYQYTIYDQDRAMTQYSDLNLYLPSKNERVVNAKLTCVDSKIHPLMNKRYNRRELLFQCQAGMDNTQGHNPSKKREIPWKDVDCTCWIRVLVTFDIEATNPSDFIAINQISGITSHSEACRVLSDVENDPPIPLHPLVRARALELVVQGSPLYFLWSEIEEFVKLHFNEGTLGTDCHRLFLESHDTSSLYRTTRRYFGIRQRNKPEETLHSWYRTDNPTPPSSLIRDSCLHYTPQITDDKESCFELVLATPDMKKAAWDHAHKQHLLMDLTFGFCSASLLLTLLMAFDKNRHGVPVGALLFSARKHAKVTHADYDTKILTKLVGTWKDGLGTNSDGEKIDIKVATTDQDPRERNTLAAHWPEIFLLLCTFHVWQSWKNALNRFLRCIPEGEPRKEIRRRLAQLLHQLMWKITSYPDAKRAFESERQYLLRLGQRRSATAKKQAKGGLVFLNYLLQYHLKSEDYWYSWSPAGAIEASQCLNIPVDDVPRTNNPLEGFNGRIKNQYIAPYTRGGRLPRVDVWVYVFVTYVIPELFKSFRDKEKHQEFHAKFCSTVPTSASSEHVPPTSPASSTASKPSSSRKSTPQTPVETPEFTVEELEQEGDVEDKEIGEDLGKVLAQDSDEEAEVDDEELLQLDKETSAFVEETQFDFDLTEDEPALDAEEILSQLQALDTSYYTSHDDDSRFLSSPAPSFVEDTYIPRSPPKRQLPLPQIVSSVSGLSHDTVSHVSETQFSSGSSDLPTSPPSSISSDSLLVHPATTPTMSPQAAIPRVTSSKQANAIMELVQAQMKFVEAAKGFIALTDDTDAVHTAISDPWV
ncbi:hypothetical protein PM082_000082 [Marasmius tenuissimus]|nr:hypothetical protein PM082_000082 [Marasmius tenuissimus]